MKLRSLDDVLLKELRDLYSAEKQLVKVLPKLARAADSTELQHALETHLEETENHVERLEEVFRMLSTTMRGPKCAAMEGLIAEASALLEDTTTPAVLNAALIGAAQRIEHYEIAGYGVARTFARVLGHHEIAEMLQKTLDEEAEADQTLTLLAESEINASAASQADRG